METSLIINERGKRMMVEIFLLGFLVILFGVLVFHSYFKFIIVALIASFYVWLIVI